MSLDLPRAKGYQTTHCDTDSDEAMSHLVLCPLTFLLMLTGYNPSFTCWIAEVSQLLTMLWSLEFPWSINSLKSQSHRIFGLERTAGDALVQPPAQSRGSYSSLGLCPVGFWVCPRMEIKVLFSFVFFSCLTISICLILCGLKWF